MTPKNKTTSELLHFFKTSLRGLSDTEVLARQEEYGRNTLPEKHKSLVKMFFSQLLNPLTAILFGAVGISLSIPLLEGNGLTGHDLIDSGVILTILLLNAGFGFFQEMKAENTLQALKDMQSENAMVIRNGKKQFAPSEGIVPGDILVLSEGDKIPADARVIESFSLHAEESALTGESLPVAKIADDVVSEQENMVFSGTAVTTGRGTALVLHTGVHTQIGKIAQLVSETDSPQTPLEKRLDALGQKIGIVIIFLCLGVFGLLFLRGTEFSQALITAVALAVSAVPEGLPAVMTISLTIGIALMARKKALVRELRAVETLGNITVIASDKTGTITQNKMRVVEVVCENQVFSQKNIKDFGNTSLQQQMKSIGQNCNNAELPNMGDPTEIALLEFCQKEGVHNLKRTDEIPFSSESKWMQTSHRIDDEKQDFLKGAPEVIAEFCREDQREAIQKSALEMAKKGLRTIAVAMRRGEEKTAEYIGIFGIMDPPRDGVKEAIETAKKAGIRTLMITGDHGITARTIAHTVGISGDVILGKAVEQMDDEQLQRVAQTTNIFARVSPTDKVRICSALQQNGEIVAMTGDGVNDAPAIHQAEVGIAMGKVGTSVARQASDLVLLDDNYATIVTGVQEGRTIFTNIKKSVSFLMQTNFKEIVLIILAVFASLPIPMLPIHILFLNLVTDSFLALSLALEPAEKKSMTLPPRPPSEGFLTGEGRKIVSLGVFCGVLQFLLFAFIGTDLPLQELQTLIFATAVCIEVALIFSIRTQYSIFDKKSGKNPWVLRASLLAFGIFAIVLFSPLAPFLKMSLFPLQYWGYAIGIAGICIVFSEGVKKVSR